MADGSSSDPSSCSYLCFCATGCWQGVNPQVSDNPDSNDPASLSNGLGPRTGSQWFSLLAISFAPSMLLQTGLCCSVLISLKEAKGCSVAASHHAGCSWPSLHTNTKIYGTGTEAAGTSGHSYALPPSATYNASGPAPLAGKTCATTRTS